MKKRVLTAIMAAALCISLAACGNKTENQPAENTTDTAADSTVVTPEQAPDEVVKDDSVIDVEENSKQPIDEAMAVDPEAVTFESFAASVQDAVALKSIEGLANLCTYPVYVGTPGKEGEGNTVNSVDDFMALGVDNVITPELITAMEGVDIAALTESKAGYTMMSGDEGPSITFSGKDGAFGITGINY